MTQQHSTRRRISAHHEAGHAVIAHRLGHKVRSVSIAPDGGGVVKVSYGSGERAILIALAGPYAQRRYAPQSRWRSRNHLGFLPRSEPARDFDVVATLMDEIGHSTEKVARAYRRYAEAQAEALVQQHWKQIEHVAQELLERGTLTGDEMLATWWEKVIKPQIKLPPPFDQATHEDLLAMVRSPPSR